MLCNRRKKVSVGFLIYQCLVAIHLLFRFSCQLQAAVTGVSQMKEFKTQIMKKEKVLDGISVQ